MKILVVDDSKTMLYVISSLLKELGYTTLLTAPSVADGKIILNEMSIDLILSDWHMPEQTGLDFLRYVRSTPEFSKIPFVLITTENEKKNIFQAVKEGVQSYIFKPVKKDLVAQKLSELAKKYNFQAPVITKS